MKTSDVKSNNRFHWIDRTKGLAILGIVLFHFFQNYPERETFINILDRNFARIGYAAVDIFFLMAGFNTSYALVNRSLKAGKNKIETNWKSWLQKRLIRLYPSYWLAVVSTCLLYSIFGDFKITWNWNFIISVLGLAGVHNQSFNPGFWFFSVILQAYLLTPIIFNICKNKPLKILQTGILLGVLNKVIAAYFLLEILLFDHNSYNYLFFLQNNFIGSYIFPFCMGLYWGFIYAENKELRKIDIRISIITFIIGLLMYGLLIVMKVDIIYMLGFDILFTPMFFIGIKSLFSTVEKFNFLGWLLSFMSILGIYSYQVYLVHQPMYFVILRPLSKMLNMDHYSKTVVILVISMILLAIYVFTFTKLENLINKIVDNFSMKKTSES
ncbi:MAG: acyltransferase [Nostocales cyanobacterium]|nr:MAG: acyltransferase [Nostocales cyanobacterium]TAF16751.1 MAG: acyltransferase [Nostocales cyanobacterium]